jgi:hypothetical protein
MNLWSVIFFALFILCFFVGLQYELDRKVTAYEAYTKCVMATNSAGQCKEMLP